MMRTKLVFVLWLVTATLQATPVELIFWHAMAGSLREEVNVLAQGFNASQPDYVIKPVYKGDYTETLTSFAAAFRAHKPPALVQIFEVGSALLLSPAGIIKPVHALMAEQGLALPTQDFAKSVSTLYSQDGKLMAMPFNLSAPVLFYNQDVLERVGYTPAMIPKTWQAMEILAEKIKQAGYACTYTTAYPGWILVESYLAIHGVPLLQSNPLRAVFNTPILRQHFQRLRDWQRKGYFKYGGRVDDATVLFTSGVCPLFSQSSGAYNSLSQLTPFRVGVAALPLDTTASRARHANVVGGAALWAVAGQSNNQYRGIAQFFVYLSQPAVQKQWQAHTGYLPLGYTGIYNSIVRTSKHPILHLAKHDLEGSANPLGRGPQNQIRSINDEVLEAMFAGLASPQAALEEAELRANRVLLRFAKNTQVP